MWVSKAHLDQLMAESFAAGEASGESRVMKGLAAVGHLNGAARPLLRRGRDGGRVDPTTLDSTSLEPPVVKAKPGTPDHASRAAALLAWCLKCEEEGRDPTAGIDAILGDGPETVEKAYVEHLHPRGKDGRWIGRDRLQAAHKDPQGKEAKELRRQVAPEDRAKLEAVLSQGLDHLGRTKRGEASHRAAAKRTARALTKSAAVALVQKLAAGEGTAEHVEELAGHLKASWASGGLSRDHLNLLQTMIGGGGKRRAEMVESLLEVARNATEKPDEVTDADREEAMEQAHRQRTNADRQEASGIEPERVMPEDAGESHDAARDKLKRMESWAAAKPESEAAKDAVGRAEARHAATLVPDEPRAPNSSAPNAQENKPAVTNRADEPTPRGSSASPRSAAAAAEHGPELPSGEKVQPPPGMTPDEHRAAVRSARGRIRQEELGRRRLHYQGLREAKEAERAAETTPPEAAKPAAKEPHEMTRAEHAQFLKDEGYTVKNKEVHRQEHDSTILRNLFREEIKADNFGRGISRDMQDLGSAIRRNTGRRDVQEPHNFRYADKRIKELYGRAIAAGKNVPAEVLADYPELAAKPAAAAPASSAPHAHLAPEVAALKEVAHRAKHPDAVPDSEVETHMARLASLPAADLQHLAGEVAGVSVRGKRMALDELRGAFTSARRIRDSQQV